MLHELYLGISFRHFKIPETHPSRVQSISNGPLYENPKVRVSVFRKGKSPDFWSPILNEPLYLRISTYTKYFIKMINIPFSSLRSNFSIRL